MMEFLDRWQVFKLTDSPMCAIKNFVVPPEDVLDQWAKHMGFRRRRHHNNKGYRQIKNGRPEKDMRNLARRLGIPYGEAE